MEIVTIVGSLAALCSMIGFVPQAWKIIRTGGTRDISAPAYMLTVTGFALWVGYGAMRADWPLIVTNAVCFLLSGFILVMTLLPDRVVKRLKRAAD